MLNDLPHSEKLLRDWNLSLLKLIETKSDPEPAFNEVNFILSVI